MLVFSSIALYFKWKRTDLTTVSKRIGIAAITGLIIMIIAAFLGVKNIVYSTTCLSLLDFHFLRILNLLFKI